MKAKRLLQYFKDLIMPQLNFKGFSFDQLFHEETLKTLDSQFLDILKQNYPLLHTQLLAYRRDEVPSPTQVSALLLGCAPVLEGFIAHLFEIESALEQSCQRTCSHLNIFEFKKYFILRRARKRIREELPSKPFSQLDHWLTQQLSQFPSQDRELAVANLAKHYLTQEERYSAEIEQLIHWCMSALITPEGQTAVSGWVSFQLPQPIHHARLVPTHIADSTGRLEGPHETRRQRIGFKLTDSRMSARQVQNEIHYCIYCHDHEGDFCSKGFPEKKGFSELRKDPLENILTGCPLDEKISEMHLLKRDGYTIAALAMVMRDNPMCAVTGHRICNDCMKACIYQKQEPVNIPEIETRVLTDVLELPWGVEIYDLLIRWNPLRSHQYVPKPYNGFKILIAGMGPAGFTLAHHLLMEGYAVVGIDGLKIEPLSKEMMETPIRDWAQLKEELDQRIMTGFGGVAEYGITVRWDKNFLKLIYLSLLRRPYFQVFGNTRLGGTLTIEDAWELGFDHVVIAVGAGLPRALSIPGSLAPGMRQASDFLMTLQLTGAAKENSLANFQVRLPAVIIGGGLTGIDTATEVQAYYLVQIEKVLYRYEQLVKTFGEDQVRKQLDKNSLEILDEFLAHAQTLRMEMTHEHPDVQKLLKSWGGVTVAYRRSMQESPAYLRNHEEIIRALEEGILYLEGLEPDSVQLDAYGQVKALVCQKRIRDVEGKWHFTEERMVLPARSIFVATGASPNIAYEFEHRGHFRRNGFQYQPFDQVGETLQPVSEAEHCKKPYFGPFTSYESQKRRVTFIGDTHPVFHGSVVKAIASAKRTYPHIVDLLNHVSPGSQEHYSSFRHKMQHLLQAKITKIHRHNEHVVELHIHAPQMAKKVRPGEFFRLQNFESFAPLIGNTRLHTEAMAMLCAGVDQEKNTISLMVLEQGASSRLCATFRPHDPVALMGPTGVRGKIPEGGETILVIGGRLAIAQLLFMGKAFQAAKNRVLYLATLHRAEDIYCREELEQVTDMIVWVTETGQPVSVRRPQDCSATGKLVEILTYYAKKELCTLGIPLHEVTRILIVGNSSLIKTIHTARHEVLQKYFSHLPTFIVSVHGPMQCMLKGICAQCLQWQIDPVTGKRTKAVFACSWQDQPLEMIDIDHIEERLSQNRLQEHLSNLWLDYLFKHYEIQRV